MSSRKRLLLIGSGEAAFREYALRSVSQRADIVLVNKSAPTWEAPYCVDSVVVDLDDFPAVIERLGTSAVDGVLTYDERYVELSAQLTELLHVPGPSVAAVRAVKDKSELRALLQRNDVGAIGFGVADTVEQARGIVAEIGLPVVFKPRALGGSAGVRMVTSHDQVESAFENAVSARVGTVRSRYDGVLIEEYIDGPELSVDSVTYDGVVTPLVVAEKETGLDPYFEEIGHIVPPRSELELSAEAIELIQRAHDVAGLNNVVTHTELRLSSRGARIIELNARLGGDLIPYLGLLAHGVDLAGAAADLALGLAPDVSRADKGAAAVRFLYPAHDLRLHSISLGSPISDLAGLDSFLPLCEPDEELLLPPRGYMSRMAALVCHGDTRELCLQALDKATDEVIVESTPLQSEPPV
ncbi:MAG TPA: ATP-grasp domain-containing protein [Jatrophihabitans sp.]|jgi:biotin carboxylase|uniref:ATP-grasp domain-containing protein n=1 Tax=Jatrophihabitans sp. TaxID=1932789 RepID=UPI002EEBC8D5